MSDIQSQSSNEQSGSSDTSNSQTAMLNTGTPISQTGQQTAEQLTHDIDAAKLGLDAASLAAQSVAQIAGLQNPEQLAQVVMSLVARLDALEKALPDLTNAYHAMMAAAATVEASIPQTWIEDVEKVVAHVKKHFSLTF